MMYIVNLVAFLSLLIMLWRGARLFSVQHGKIFFDPAAFFLAGYLLIVLVPHIFIYNLSMFATHNVTFAQGQTATTMLTACLFGVVWSIVVTVAQPSVAVQRATFERAAAFPEKPGTKLMGVALMLAVAFAFQIFLFGISGPVGGHMLLGMLKGDLSGFYSQYNELRYAVTTQPFLEAGVRGLGTLTSIMENLANAALVLGVYLSKGLRPGPKFLVRALLILLTLYIALTTGTRTALIYYAIYLTIVIMIINQKNRVKNGFFYQKIDLQKGSVCPRWYKGKMSKMRAGSYKFKK